MPCTMYIFTIRIKYTFEQQQQQRKCVHKSDQHLISLLILTLQIIKRVTLFALYIPKKILWYTEKSVLFAFFYSLMVNITNSFVKNSNFCTNVHYFNASMRCIREACHTQTAQSLSASVLNSLGSLDLLDNEQTVFFLIHSIMKILI